MEEQNRVQGSPMEIFLKGEIHFAVKAPGHFDEVPKGGWVPSRDFNEIR